MSEPFKLPSPSVNDRSRGDVSESTSKPFLFIPVKISNHNRIHELSALIDSGADHNFIDSNLVRQLQLPVESLDTPIKAAGLGGKKLSRITLRTEPILFVYLIANITSFLSLTPRKPL